MSESPPVPPPAVLLASVSVSAAAVLVRLAPDAHPVAVALWRTALVGCVLAPSLVSLGRPSKGPQRKDWLLMPVAGLLLAGHFWAWFASLGLTTVLRSTLLVCLSPIWTGLLGWAWLGERPTGSFFVGVALAVLGAGIMSGGAASMGGGLEGDGLALLGGLLASLYLLVGRRVRQRVSIGVGRCLSGCAAWLLPVSVLLEVPLGGYGRETWLALLAAGPQLIGHIGLNYVFGFFLPPRRLWPWLVGPPFWVRLCSVRCCRRQNWWVRRWCWWVWPGDLQPKLHGTQRVVGNRSSLEGCLAHPLGAAVCRPPHLGRKDDAAAAPPRRVRVTPCEPVGAAAEPDWPGGRPARGQLRDWSRLMASSHQSMVAGGWRAPVHPSRRARLKGNEKGRPGCGRRTGGARTSGVAGTPLLRKASTIRALARVGRGPVGLRAMWTQRWVASASRTPSPDRDTAREKKVSRRISWTHVVPSRRGPYRISA